MEKDPFTGEVIGCAIEVHRVLGPGLLESAYEEALCVELDEAGVRYRRQVAVPIIYKGRALGEYRLDLLVEDAVVVDQVVRQLRPGGYLFVGHSETLFEMDLPIEMVQPTVYRRIG